MKVVHLDLKKLCLNKIFWMAISASFAFTMIMFNISMSIIDVNAEFTKDAIEANTEAIQVVNTDIKQILVDTSYIRGIVDSNSLLINPEK